MTGHAAGTTYGAAVILPPATISQPLPCKQVPVGDDLLSCRQTVCYDNFALYQNGIESLNIAFVGKIGNGKSSAIKTYLERMLILPEQLDDGTWRDRRAVIIDPKGEYRQLAELFGCRPVVLGHGQCFNPLDERLSEQQQLAILENFVILLRGHDLSDLEGKCLKDAHKQARATWDRTQPFVLDDVRRALLTMSDEFIASTLRDRGIVNPVAADLSFSLEKLIDGSLAGMFNEPTTPALNWSGQVIDITVAADYRTRLAYQLLVACLSVWLEQDDHIDFFAVEEAWDFVKVREFAELLQSKSKLGRSRGLSVIAAFQGPSDAKSAGNVGDAQVEIALRLLEDCDTFFLFKMSRNDAELLRGVAQLTDDDIRTITELEPHRFLLVVGTGERRRRFLVEHRITDDEAALVNSNP